MDNIITIKDTLFKLIDRAQLFKTKYVVSSCFVKISNINITNTLLFFVEKNLRILCTAKDSHIFSTKNNSVFVTLADICLTNLCLNDIVKLTML